MMVRSGVDYTFNATLLEEVRAWAVASLVAQKRCVAKNDDTAAPPPTTVSVAPPLRTVSTAATVEVDIMPFLARKRDAGNRGGNFSGYFEALKHLGNSFVRFAPWFPYWQVRTH
jgi:hypothetical protein